VKILLKPGEELQVGFYEPGGEGPHGGDFITDGEITIQFEKTAIRVSADLPDTQKRVGVIYEELFGQALAAEQMKKIMADLPPAPKLDPAMYRVTPEQKAFGDKRVAANLREKHDPDGTIFKDYNDTELADAYDVFRYENTDDDKFPLWLHTPTTSEPGEHQVVIDAIDGCNDGEER
jgi:hypothetical protein